MAIYCSNCGAELPDGVAFCDACGTPVRGQAANAGASPMIPAGAPAGGGGAPASGSAGGGTGIGTTACPVCGANALPGEAFCDNCGAALLSPAAYAGGSGAGSPSASRPNPSAPPPPTYSNAPAAAQPQYNYGSARHVTASFVITSPPPPATLSIPDRAELIVGRSDPQSNSYPDVDLGPYGGLELGVSRRHFRLTRNGDHFYLEDLNAMNGSVVNGQRVPAYTLQPLRSGDKIVLGKLEILFETA